MRDSQKWFFAALGKLFAALGKLFGRSLRLCGAARLRLSPLCPVLRAADNLLVHDKGYTARVRPVLVSSVVFAVLEFIALARYPDVIDYSSPKAWLYLLFLLNILLVGLLGLLASRQAMSRHP